MLIDYESTAEADMRLRNTIVLYNSKPVYVKGVHEDGEVTGWSLENVEYSGRHGVSEYIADWTDEGWDIGPFKLGYVNVTKSSCVYCYRMPVRKFRQGLSRDNVKVIKGKYEDLLNKNLTALVERKYPTLEQVLENTKFFDGVWRQAIHRLVGVNSKGKVGYKNMNTIGDISFSTGEIELKSEYEYLRNFLIRQNFEVK